MRIDRLALLTTLALLGVNLATTGRWTDVPGALHGWRLPYVAVSIVIVALLALRHRVEPTAMPAWLPGLTAAVGLFLLVGGFLYFWMPWRTWGLTPFLDDWPARFQSTVEGVRLLRHGTFAGWRWPLLGGYAMGTDLNQSLTLVGALPMIAFGDAFGYHLTHLLLFLALPALIVWDLARSEARALTRLSAGFVAMSAAGAAWNFMRSGDTNSLSGLVGVTAVVAASHYAHTRGRYGLTALVVSLGVTAYSNVSYVPYALALLVLEALYYRDASRLRVAGAAAILAAIASLPATYELLRYPSEFVINNFAFGPANGLDVGRAVRKIFYHFEIMWLPARWLNDAAGLASLFLPCILIAAWRREGRAGFYAWAALLADGLMRLTINETGATFARSVHLLIVYAPVAVAWFVVTRIWHRSLAVAVTVLIALCFQISSITVPHVPSVSAFLPELTTRIRTLDDGRVLVENNPHRDTDASPQNRSEPSLYGVHYEALLPEATGKQLYAGFWDGWQFTRFNGEMLAGGAWQGRLLADDDRAAFIGEMRRWGVRHLFVWSKNATSRLSAWPEFALVWRNDPWREYALLDTLADPRLVTSAHGHGQLVATTPLGGVVRLADVEQGDRVVVRTHFHPAWQIRAGGQALTAFDEHGQLSFAAPSRGSYDVELVYPPRRWLLACPVTALVLVLLVDRRRRRSR